MNYFYLFQGLVAVGLVLLATSGLAQAPQVTIPGLGVVEGSRARSWINDRPYFEFQGIPFASPPIGARRFQVLYILKKVEKLRVTIY